ncbi:hypothetical protein MCUN1_001347 [Malassezia cuniculi]|uniref:Small nuclear ribonucleoprotein Prp3 C-terminal domain-containing protein n=1 Tax=Malassezia cuniculi TaxID=948313 RepID=A0AAF0EQ35_9BASI|nr:hypothetical protein MCUN1_001347 [Malassezia cuniculi]
MGLADLALVRASLADGDFEWRGSQDEATVWQKALDDAAAGEDVQLANPMHCAIRIADGIWVNASVGDGMPNATVSAAHLDSDAHKRLSEIVRQHLDSSEELPLFDIVVQLQEAVAELPVPSEQPREPTPPPSHGPCTMARVMFWAHHLVAPSKRRQLAAWCPELRVWGIIKLGYPGYLCFEGEEKDVADIASRVRHMQWHALSLRTEETWSYSGTPEEALRACPFAQVDANARTLRTHCEEITDMGEFVARYVYYLC